MSRIVLSKQQLNDLGPGTRVKVVGYVIDYAAGIVLLRLPDDQQPFDIDLRDCPTQIKERFYPGMSVAVDGYCENDGGTSNYVNPIEVVPAGLDHLAKPEDTVNVLRQMAQIRSQSSMS